jgi:hypothetical protein
MTVVPKSRKDLPEVPTGLFDAEWPTKFTEPGRRALPEQVLAPLARQVPEQRWSALRVLQAERRGQLVWRVLRSSHRHLDYRPNFLG